MISSIPCAMANLLVPDWPAPARVRSLQTLRGAGCSPAPWDSFNLGDHVGDDPANVAANRGTLRDHLPAEPAWLKQVHGIATVNPKNSPNLKEADAAFTRDAGVVCAVMTADCLPVLFCDRAGASPGSPPCAWSSIFFPPKTNPTKTSSGIFRPPTPATFRPPAPVVAATATLM